MIHLLPNPEQVQIIDSVRDFLSQTLPASRLIQQTSASDHAQWQALAELGCFGISHDDDLGGLGLSLADEALVFRAFGEALLSPSVLAGWLAVRLAQRAGQADLARDFIAGEVRAALALPKTGAKIAAQVTGDFHLIDAIDAGYLIAVGPEGLALLQTPPLPEAKPTSDWSMPVHATRLDQKAFFDTAPELISAFELLSAAMSCGIADGVRDVAVDYAKIREQFGKPIGSFQAVKHRCSDMELRCESAWDQTIYAALAEGAGEASAEYDRHCARILANRAAIENAENAIQVLGGIGFTAETTPHIFLKRAQLLSRLGRSLRAHQLDLLALDLPVPARSQIAASPVPQVPA